MKIDPYDHCTYIQSQAGANDMDFWQCCKHNYAPGIPKCKVCGALQPDAFDLDGHRVDKWKDAAKPAAVDARKVLADERKKDYAKKQRKIQSKIKPGDDDQLFTSTKSWD